MWNELDFKHHREEHHGSEEKEVDKASTGKEHTKDGVLFDEPMLSARSNEEILPCLVLSMEVYNYIGEVESADIIELPKLSHSVESRVHKQQRKKEKNGND